MHDEIIDSETSHIDSGSSHVESAVMSNELTRNYRPFSDSRPYTRWWWFYDDIRMEHIRSQLEWVRDQGFGGVEIAFMYPQPGAGEGPRWLSEAWTGLVAGAKEEADRLGIGCDFTFSTSWPFGGSIVPEEDGGQVFDGPSDQRLEKSWELSYYGQGRILNHLDPDALGRYAGHVGGALEPALRGTTSGLFSDSWEVFPEGLWSAHLDPVFRDRFGYDLEPFKASIDEHPDVRYDYRKLLSDAAIEGFFRPYADICRRLGAVSRVQCHGAPADLLEAFALVDVPESEALLFETFFSAIPGSAAALGARPVVTCETFTCIYGYAPWPAPSPHHGEEKVEDLKLMADAVFANGVNHIVWHGMPYNAPGGSNTFYATTHVGPDSGFAGRLPAFNAYLTEAADFVKQGRTYTDVAVYLPLEDHWMRHMLPEDRRGPAANYYWELQTVERPARSSWLPSSLDLDALPGGGGGGGRARPVRRGRILHDLRGRGVAGRRRPFGPASARPGGRPDLRSAPARRSGPSSASGLRGSPEGTDEASPRSPRTRARRFAILPSSAAGTRPSSGAGRSMATITSSSPIPIRSASGTPWPTRAGVPRNGSSGKWSCT